TLYACKDLVAGYFNSKLNSNLTYESLQALYLQKCGVQLPVFCISNTPGENAPDSSDNNNIIVYPNPAKNDLFIKFAQQPIGEINYVLIDINGRIIRKEKLNNYRIDLKGFSAGMYFIKVYSNEKLLKTLKIIHQP